MIWGCVNYSKPDSDVEQVFLFDVDFCNRKQYLSNLTAIRISKQTFSSSAFVLDIHAAFANHNAAR